MELSDHIAAMLNLSDQIAALLDELRLPPHIHATVLAGVDETTGAELAYPVVWADRAYTTCPRCKEPVGRQVDCPLMLDAGAGQGGAIREWDQRHGCGEWLPVLSAEVPVDVGDANATDQVESAARELAEKRRQALDAERARIRAGLVRDLKWALSRLATPLASGETPEDRIWAVSRGIAASEAQQPGVWLDTTDRAWVAWDHDPAAEDGEDVILESVETVPFGQAAAMLGVTRQRVAALAGEGKLERGSDGRVTVASVLDRMGV